MRIKPNDSYHQVLNMMWNLLVHIFDNLNKNHKDEIEYIRSKLPFDDLIYSSEPLIIEFSEGVKLLNENGFEQDEFEDLSTPNEKALGQLVKDKYGSDLFILDKYPLAARPFYTMPHPENHNYSCSYDVILRGQEISSGAQRVNDYEMLLQKVKEHGIDPDSMKSYLESFSHGSPKHGGCGFGLERIVMLFLNLENIRQASMCPRDPKRIIP
jgi:aspartyl-tRNA synthetase